MPLAGLEKAGRKVRAMFDTIRLCQTFRSELCSPTLDLFTPLNVGRKAYIHSKSVFNPRVVDGYALPRVTVSKTVTARWYVSAEVSLPKMLHGNNVHILSGDEVGYGLDMITEFVSKPLGVYFDARTALVGRVDYCWNFNVGETRVRYYLDALTRAYMARLRTVTRKDTMYFESESKSHGKRRRRSRQIKFYDKAAEVKSGHCNGGPIEEELAEAARGLLRIESSIIGARRCQDIASKYGRRGRTATDLLCEDVAVEILNENLKELGLHAPILPSAVRSEVYRKLRGVKSLPRLDVFLKLYDQSGGNLRHDGSGSFSQASFYRYRKALSEAGLLLCTYAPTPLPPLIVPSQERRQVDARSPDVPMPWRENLVDCSYSTTDVPNAGSHRR
jgi:hypothetical protein